jgi:putative sigma-54 modulation protein
MNIMYNFKNFEPSDHLKDYARTRFEKLSKFVHNFDNVEMQVNLGVEKFRQMAEVVFDADNIHLSAYEESEDMYSTIDMVLDKLETQVKKIREKMVDNKKRREAARDVRMDVISFATSDSGQRTPTIVETDSYKPKPMDVEEAAMQLDTLNFDFLVFRNADTDGINVIYRRKNGDFGLIDPGTA